MNHAVENNATETVVLLPVDQCHKSPTQPRRRGGEKMDDDFVASIREKGVLQPIVVRASVGKAGDFEIVFGHRRHAGSVLAKRATIPAIVREMSDDDVFDAQLIENVHRNDMHPLDEADGFKRMIERGRTVQQIADKLGRPPTYVAQRLKLCELGKEARAALDEEEISLGVAVLIARVPPSLQAEALDSLWEGMSAQEAKRRLEESYLLRLDQAPFDIASATLVPKAGACTACPKRTGQQRELFPDAARADMCTDRVCFRGKLDALWQIRSKEAKASGQQVLEGKAAERAIAYGGGYRSLDDQEYVGDKAKKVRTLLGKDLPPITLARNERTGAVVELVKSADVDKALKRSPRDHVYTRSDSERRQEEKDRRRAAAVNLALISAVEKVEKSGRMTHDDLIRLLTHSLAQRTWNDAQQAIVRRRGLDKIKTKGYTRSGVEQQLLAHLKTLNADGVAGLGVELALRSVAPRRFSPPEPIWADTLKALGIDFAAIEKKIADEAKAKKKAKTKTKTTVKRAA